ncbi:MAG: RadC family protein [Ardenticatenaceae bacterium]
MPTITQHPRRRLIRELPLSLRPATRLARVGSDQLTITELIAIVLNTTDALDLAQEIVCEFTIEDLPQTTLSELQLLHGIGPSRAGQLLAAIELGSRLVNYRTDHPQIKSPKDAAEILMPKLKHEQQEHFIVMPVNMKNRMLMDIVWLYKGTLNSSVLRNGEVYREAIRRQAAAIIVAHNHPSGDPTPSPEDIRVTRELRKAGELLDIDLLDHLIIGDGRFVSMKEKGFGF